MPSRVWQLRNEVALRKHHFECVKAVEVRPLPRTPIFGGVRVTRGLHHIEVPGVEHYIYLAPATVRGPKNELLEVFCHEVGHAYHRMLQCRLRAWKRDPRFQAVYHFKKQFERHPRELRQFGLSPHMIDTTFAEFYADLFSCAVGGFGWRNQQALHTYWRYNIKQATLSDLVGFNIGD